MNPLYSPDPLAALPFAAAPDDYLELFELVPPLYPSRLTERQAVARYAAWVAGGFADLRRFLHSQGARPER